MTRKYITFWLILFSFGAALPAFSQSYFRILEQPLSSFFQRIACFPNGDILIGDAITGSLSGSNQQQFYLARLDPCGEILWQKNFSEQSHHLTFDQITIDDAGHIYVYGSFLEGLREQIYILKLSGNGQLLGRGLWDRALNDNVTYSIDYEAGQLMLFGALSDAGSPEHSHLMLLDTNLNVLQSWQYGPFEAYGEGIALQNGGALLVNGMTIMQADASGQLNWARTMQGFGSYIPTSIPLEVQDGTIHAVHFSGLTWFFKIDTAGNLAWQSAQFPAFYHLPEMEILPNGDFLAVYNETDTNGIHPVLLRASAEGQILSQERLSTTYPINSGFVGITLFDDRRVNLFGNVDIGVGGGLEREDFLLQVDLEDADPECFAFVPFSSQQPNTFGLSLAPATLSQTAAPVTEVPMFEVRDTNLILSFEEVCAFEPFDREVRQDTIMDCGEEWVIALPGPEFSWRDGHLNFSRVVSEAG
ncbi:MAG: hypothetical protein AAF570_04555, partial [Bacteroidota bacterium]